MCINSPNIVKRQGSSIGQLTTTSRSQILKWKHHKFQFYDLHVQLRQKYEYGIFRSSFFYLLGSRLETFTGVHAMFGMCQIFCARNFIIGTARVEKLWYAPSCANRRVPSNFGLLSKNRSKKEYVCKD